MGTGPGTIREEGRAGEIRGEAELYHNTANRTRRGGPGRTRGAVVGLVVRETSCYPDHAAGKHHGRLPCRWICAEPWRRSWPHGPAVAGRRGPRRRGRAVVWRRLRQNPRADRALPVAPASEHRGRP